MTIECTACGEYDLSDGAARDLLADHQWADHSKRALASGHIRESWQRRFIPAAEWKRITNVPEPSREEKKVKLLLGIKAKAPRAGETIAIRWDAPEWHAIGWCTSNNELGALMRELKDHGDINGQAQQQNHVFVVSLTAQGEQRLNSSGKSNALSRVGFIAMAFRGMDEAHQAIRRAIEDAGFSPYRVDDEYKAGRIDDHILQAIRDCRFVVADLTHHRGGVYYEAGFALALNIPVVFACRNDHFDDIHFDIRQHNCVKWSDPAELAAKLATAIRQAL